MFAETCPQYLYLNLEDHLGAARLRGRRLRVLHADTDETAHHHDDLWRGLATNDLWCCRTDHCPFCMKEQKELGLDDFRKIPNGLGTVEHRMDLLYQGVVQGKISLPRWVELSSTTPARMFGMYPGKGTIAPGADADIVLYDPSATWTIWVDNHHMAIDHSAWEGIEIQGKVDTVLSRGKIIVQDDAYLGSAGDGRYRKRGLSQYLI